MKQKIYLLEDDEGIRFLIQFILEEAGYQVFTFAQVMQLREAMARELPDLLITDIWLPDGDGRSYCKELREQETTRELKVLMMTAQYGIQEFALADDFISKPFEIEEFTARVRNLLADTSVEK